MKISTLKETLKEMSKVVAFKDDETDIFVSSRELDPPCRTEIVRIETKINNFHVVIKKMFNEE